MTTSVLSRHLDPRAICLRVTADSPEEVIDLLAGRLHAIGAVRDTYAEAVKAREGVMPTGLPLEEGVAVAVPHTDPEHVVTPALAVATLSRPVHFRSMEDPETELAVSLVFTLALRDKNEQIEMLQTIAATLQNAPLLRRIAAASSAKDVIAAFDDPNGKEGGN